MTHAPLDADPVTNKLSQLDERLRAVERITELFRAERFVYLTFAILAFLLLLVCVVLSLTRETSNTTAALGAFGSSGVVAYTSSRVLLMWSRAIAIVSDYRSNAHGDES